MKNIITFIVFFIALNIFPFSGGNGTAGNPYQVATAADLNDVRNNLSSNFVQTADIDLTSATTSGGAYYNAGKGWIPIRNSSDGNPFTGNYNGNGHIIIGLTISQSLGNNIDGQTGLFAYCSGSTITDLGVVDANITGQNYNPTGILIGMTGDCTVTNCYTTGTVRNMRNVGGFIGGISGTSSSVTKCYSTANVYYYDGNDQSDNSGLGGFAGTTWSGGTISNCYCTGNVTGTNQAEGQIGTTDKVGGFIGFNQSDVTISNCYCTGTLSGGTNAGGFGYNQPYVPSVYEIWFVWEGVEYGNWTQEVHAGYVNNCFWDNETNGGAGTNNCAADKTTSEMKTQSTYTNAGWDFTTIWNIIATNYPDLSGNSNPTLPVELTSFNGSVKNRTVNLKWVTATEENTASFEVERMSEGNNWSAVGLVKACGVSNSPKIYAYSDTKARSGKNSYRLRSIDNDGSYEYSKVIEVDVELPKSFELSQNYPNPFNPTTKVDYQIPFNANINIELYSITGEQIATLVNGQQNAGYYTLMIDAGALKLASGTYIYRIRANAAGQPAFVQTKKILLLK